MSGVYGIASRSDAMDIEKVASNMAAAMKHEDWYIIEQAIDWQERVVLGRLGIGIFNKNPQPLWNAARTVALVLAGEFYRYEGQERSRYPGSDEQLALEMYARFGESFANHLEGVFLVALWDRNRKQILITNDRAGHYPVYYAQYHDKLVFAPEVKAFFCDPDFQKALDLRALAEYMRFQFMIGDKTFFEGIKILPNASYLYYDLTSGMLSIQLYWDLFQTPEQRRITFEEAVEEGGSLLKAAVKKRTEGNYRLGVYLSGGMDSRAILGFIDRSKFPLPSVTYGKRDSRDVAYSQMLAKRAGTNHHYFEFENGKWVMEHASLHLEMTEGFHSWIHSHGISILKDVRPLMEVNLGGYGGFEINWEDLSLLNATDDLSFAVNLFNQLSQNTTWPSLNDAEERLLYSPGFSSRLTGLAFDSFREELAKYQGLPYDRVAATFSRYHSDRRMFMYYTVFHRGYIELRFPLTDYDYVDFVHSIPPVMHFQRKLRRAIIRKWLPEVAGVPYDKDALPITGDRGDRFRAEMFKRGKSFINRRFKKIFPEYATLNSDYENWLRGDLKEWGENILLGEKTLQRGIFRPDFLRSLWQRHQSGLEPNFIGKVAPIMTYEMLLRKFYQEW